MTLALLLSAYPVVASLLSLGNVSGVVSGADGELAGVEVTLDGTARALTDDEGRFLFSGVEEGAHTLSVEGSEVVEVEVLPGASLNRPLSLLLRGDELLLLPPVREEVPPKPTGLTTLVYATREGLVGGTTANGHIIVPRDHFVALPNPSALCPDDDGNWEFAVLVRNPANDSVTLAPVWDVGPWNIYDDYWWAPRAIYPHLCYTTDTLPAHLPESEAAYFFDYNTRYTGYLSSSKPCGQYVLNPAGIDLADGTFWDSLGMADNGWVEVTFTWVGVEEAPPSSGGLSLAARRGALVAVVPQGAVGRVSLYDLAGRELAVLARSLGPGEHRLPLPNARGVVVALLRAGKRSCAAALVLTP